ncbi:MAG: hypothetical protein JXR78_10180, partial [Victivallales bacterium]|nr:hypothetical protein [Victivallales bacterium]
MFWKKDGIGNCCMVVIQGGTKIYALVIKAGTPVARNEFEPGVEPREVVRWGKRNRAQNVKWLLPSDIYDVRAEIPADADFEERALAFNYELAALSGQSSDSIRPSVWIEDERRGGRRDRYCSGIAVDFINELAEACRRERMKFGGVGGLQQAILAYYASMGDSEAGRERSLLMFMRDNAFLAGASGGSLSFRNIPFGLPG